jgi:phosphoribosyl-AMP cyclohydrolase
VIALQRPRRRNHHVIELMSVARKSAQRCDNLPVHVLQPYALAEALQRRQSARQIRKYQFLWTEGRTRDAEQWCSSVGFDSHGKTMHRAITMEKQRPP